MNTNYIFAFAFGIGVVAGLRSLTAPAAVSWAAYLGWLGLQGSPLGFMASIPTVALFSLLAIGELIGDLLPKTPKRTAPAPLIARIVTGGFAGACLCLSAGQSWLIGSLLGGVGGVMGTFSGYEIRRGLVKALKIKDVFIALAEDLVALSLAWLFVSQ
jgi:uncharacterized membrane protein